MRPFPVSCLEEQSVEGTQMKRDPLLFVARGLEPGARHKEVTRAITRLREEIKATSWKVKGRG